MSLAIFGLDSAYVTKVPDSDVGHAAINSMRYFGVDTSKVAYGGERLGLYYLEKGASQRPSKVIYDRAYSSISRATSEDFDWDNIFDGADWFHWTGINPALSDDLAAICEEACKVAKAKGLTVSCDLNYRGKLWTPEKAQSVMKPLMQYVDVLIANEEDSEKVLGLKYEGTDVESAELDRAGYIWTAEKIHQLYGCKKIATTLRKSFSASRNGWSAMLYDGAEGKAYFSDEYDIQIIDRVGGGDSFAGGLIYALTQEMPCQEAIDFAVAASCLKHTMEGDYNRTTVADVKNLLKSGGNGRVIR